MGSKSASSRSQYFRPIDAAVGLSAGFLSLPSAGRSFRLRSPQDFWAAAGQNAGTKGNADSSPDDGALAVAYQWVIVHSDYPTVSCRWIATIFSACSRMRGRLAGWLEFTPDKHTYALTAWRDSSSSSTDPQNAKKDDDLIYAAYRVLP